MIFALTLSWSAFAIPAKILTPLKDLECSLRLRNQKILLVVGLGNVGYDGTRHNAGFQAIDKLIRLTGAQSFGSDEKWLTFEAKSEEEAAEYVEFSGASSPRREDLTVHYRVGGEVFHAAGDIEHLVFVKPYFDINESGHFVGDLVGALHLRTEQIFVVYDEINFPPNQIGWAEGKASGEGDKHNGIRSINEKVGTGAYHRLRLGVGRPTKESGRRLPEWVLGPMPADLAEFYGQVSPQFLEIAQLVSDYNSSEDSRRREKIKGEIARVLGQIKRIQKFGGLSHAL